MSRNCSRSTTSSSVTVAPTTTSSSGSIAPTTPLATTIVATSTSTAIIGTSQTTIGVDATIRAETITQASPNSEPTKISPSAIQTIASNSASSGQSPSANPNQNGLENQSNQEKSGQKTTTAIAVSVVVVAVLIIAGAVTAFFLYKRLKSDPDVIVPIPDDFSAHWIVIDGQNVKLLGNVMRGEKIGEGAFGLVYQGKLDGATDVAMKTAGNQLASDMKKEIKLLAQLRHKNILQYYGIYRSQNVLYIVTELMVNGNLLGMLRKNVLSEKVLFSMAQDIIRGLIRIHAENIVHRDLAARNILIDGDNVAKIADLGMSQYIQEANLPNERLPFRWTAPELLKQERLSIESDVYSYGCLLHEMFSGGHQPWDGIDLGNIREMVCSGQMMPQSEGCPNVMYELMRKCWNKDPARRPSAKSVLKKFEKIDSKLLKSEVVPPIEVIINPEPTVYE